MIVLNKIDVNSLKSLQDKGLYELFPFSQDYIESPIFNQQRYEWFYITDDSYQTEEERTTWLGLICTTEDKYFFGDNLHLSCLEVAKPLRGLNIGTSIMNYLIDLAHKNLYKSLSLQVSTEGLVSFYTRFGFKKSIVNGGTEVYILNL